MLSSQWVFVTVMDVIIALTVPCKRLVTQDFFGRIFGCHHRPHRPPLSAFLHCSHSLLPLVLQWLESLSTVSWIATPGMS